jgi:hypothetical protein
VSRSRLRIAYLAHGVGGRDTGVHAKILSQASTWAALDQELDVGIFVRCEAGDEDDWLGQPHVVAVSSSRFGIIGRFFAREALSRTLTRWEPDVIYTRQSTPSPSVIALMGRIPTVVEINTLDLAELRLRSPIRYLYSRVTRDFMLRRAAGLIAVSGEIARHPTVTRLGLPVTIVPNGINLAAHPILGPTGNAIPRLVFLGTPGHPWHGLDKIARLGSRFPSWTIDLIGPSPSDVPGLPANVIAHGSLDRGALLPIMAAADVAIGSLALHRNLMDEASPLKVADYLAYGVPAIIAYTDSRFPRGAPFLLQLPNTEDNVDTSADDIHEFVERWRGRRVAREDIASIDSGTVETERLCLLVAQAKRSDRRGR